MRLRTLLTGSLAAAALAACDSARDAGQGSKGANAPAGALAVNTSQRTVLRVVGRDTLSDSAYIVRLVPEPDGDAVAFVFADPERRIHAGLGIAQHDSASAQLLWPDSVTTVWWGGPHAISFSTETGRGAYVVVDVHAKEAKVAPPDSARQTPPTRADTATAIATAAAHDAAERRAIAFLDSLHVQPTGRPQGGAALRYEVRSVLMARGGRFGAFYASATDSAGRRVNPAWFIIDPRSGAVAQVDEVVGPASELPERAGGWTETTFVFAKRLGLYETVVR
ncbi:MAG TPA: hypothetical protein VKA84_11325 [Gemmatimonadaceae bacterium]|nr:hypothetical protein [Gemmatimonadaceae bacterium]